MDLYTPPELLKSLQTTVVVNGVESDWATVLSGVPLDTILGPLLFSLKINEIKTVTEPEIRFWL